MKYLFPHSEATTFNKHGVDITVYGSNLTVGNMVYEETEHGHLEEFYDEASTYVWFVIEGTGTFVVNDEHIKVEAKDQIVVPPNTRVHYFGQLKMVLAAMPAYEETNVHHVRDVNSKESPYL